MGRLCSLMRQGVLLGGAGEGASGGVSKWPPWLEHSGLLEGRQQPGAERIRWRAATQAPGSSPDGKSQALQLCSIATGHEHAPARGFVVQTRLHMYEGDKMGFDT